VARVVAGMVGRMPPGDRSIDPGELLRSALEKIVFFECKVAQLESELAAARQVAERARVDAAQARQREAELGHQVAEAQSARAGLQLRDADLSERVRLLETERERLMAGLVERARVGGAACDDGRPGPEEGGADLAGFISELRAEIEQLRSWKAEAG
jgi:chromosome segregation ATPase